MPEKRKNDLLQEDSDEKEKRHPADASGADGCALIAMDGCVYLPDGCLSLLDGDGCLSSLDVFPGDGCLDGCSGCSLSVLAVIAVMLMVLTV